MRRGDTDRRYIAVEYGPDFSGSTRPSAAEIRAVLVTVVAGLICAWLTLSAVILEVIRSAS